MIYRVMSVCWKACGARLLSSQRQRRGEKNTTENSYLLLFWRETPLLCVSSPGHTVSEAKHPGKDWRCCFLWQQSWAHDGVLWGHPGQPLIHGTSLLEGVSCHMFPESLLRYCCVTGLSLDQAGFSTGYPKNISLILEDESPTRQTIHLLQAFFYFFAGVGSGGEDGLGAVRLAS